MTAINFFDNEAARAVDMPLFTQTGQEKMDVRKIGHPFVILGCRNQPGYSVRRATTGSFLAALREGMMPEIRVRPVLMTTSMMATGMGSLALR